MSLTEALQQIIAEEVEKKIFEMKQEEQLKSPWVKIEKASEMLEKKPKWIRDNLCTYETTKRGLVKKIGKEWHFLNPEFFNFVHDEWWSKQK